MIVVLKIVSSVFHSLMNIITCTMYFSLFVTSFYFGYLSYSFVLFCCLCNNKVY